ncbi:MAG: hypothetical protein IJ668_00055 [Selenomonadaceae bacterium]|nr:hypothetical protein [Selenomonadaceae bacterium]
MLRRERAEAVNGLTVEAGGNRLICIGNKPIRAGDYVWTDGRCVYGFERRSQMPFVPTVADKDEQIIPFVENKIWWHYPRHSVERKVDDNDVPAGRLFLMRKSQVKRLKHKTWSGVINAEELDASMMANVEGGDVELDTSHLCDAELDEIGNVFALFKNCRLYRNDNLIADFFDKVNGVQLQGRIEFLEITSTVINAYPHSASYVNYAAQLLAEYNDPTKSYSFEANTRQRRRFGFNFIHPYIAPDGQCGALFFNDDSYFVAGDTPHYTENLGNNRYYGEWNDIETYYSELFLFADGEIKTLSKYFVVYHQYCRYTYSWLDGVGQYDTEISAYSDHYILQNNSISFDPHSVRVPMQDGGFFTFDLNSDEQLADAKALWNPEYVYHSELKFYDRDANLLFALKKSNAKKISLYSTLNVLAVDAQNFLILESFAGTSVEVYRYPRRSYKKSRLWLFDADQNSLNLISSDILNLRLYHMHLKKWLRRLKSFKQ